jgi:NitT/TauT family transport system substrate-binding protein
MKAVAIAVGHSEGANVVARKDAGFKTLDEVGGDLARAWRQFRGKVIGLPPQGSIQDAVTRTGLSEAGLGDRDVELRNYKSVPSLPDLLAQGQIDAFVGWPPFDVVAIEEKKAGMVSIPGDRLGGKVWSGYPMNCLVASERILREYPDVVEDCVFLHTRVNQFIMAYPDEAAKMAAAILKISEPLTLKGYYLTPNFCPEITEATIDSCLRFVKTLLDAKYITNALTAAQIFNTTFVRKVQPGRCTERVGRVRKDPQLFEFVTGRKA